MGRGKAHSEADNTVRDNTTRIRKDQQNGRKPSTPDIVERGDAITTREDIREARRQE